VPDGCISELCISRYWANNLTTLTMLGGDSSTNPTRRSSTDAPPSTAIDYTTHPITTHRQTFINATHLDQLHALGITFLRVPLGHWATELDPVDPYVPGALIYIDWLMEEVRSPA
jgi:hypothetical protein